MTRSRIWPGNWTGAPHAAIAALIGGGLVSILCLPLPAGESPGARLTVDSLRCEYRANPLGLEVVQPRLSWVLHSDARNQAQTAYHILVASSPQRLAQEIGDLWDSGPIASAQQNQIPYAGRPLRSHQPLWWKVRVWDQDDLPTPWSPPAHWTMGLLHPTDWQAQWIQAVPLLSNTLADGHFIRFPEPDPSKGAPPPKPEPLPLFRREFQTVKPLRRALIYLCGLGSYELRLNGRKVGDHVLDPGWTDYRKTCLYTTYDVTDLITQGANALGVMLGNGMYNVSGGRYVKFTGSFGPPKLILHLRLEYADGFTSNVVSDASWQTAPGPIRFSCIYGGEDYDARLEQPGWDQAGFTNSGWKPSQITQGPKGRLRSQSAPPIKVSRVLHPIQIAEPTPGRLVYDLGQNFSGWPELKVRGPAGAVVTMIPGELLNETGLVSQRSSGGPVSFAYTLKGSGVESWHPRFSYYGFRYVQVEGAVLAPADPDGDQPQLLELTGQFVHSSAETVGAFSCSNPLFNRIHDLIDRAIECNLQSVLTDCPHREKLGWLEVSHLLAPAIMFNYDVPTFYGKICRDMQDAQLPSGLVPDIAPEYTVFSGGFRDSPEWGSACLINPWHLYRLYGDRQALEDHYDMMSRYVSYLEDRATGHILTHGLGDWYDIGPGGPGESKLTTKGLTATAIYYQDLTILEQTASILGKPEAASHWAAHSRQVQAAFQTRFFHPDSNHYDQGSQTANAMPLALGLVPPDRRKSVLDNLVQDVRAHDNHLTAGDVGFRYLLLALTQGGRSDVIFDLLTRTNPPSYGSQIARGATTLTEAWDANPSSSQNHCMLGHAEEWFYAGLAGIQPAPDAVGYDKLVIRPQVVGDVTWVKARYHSIRGPIVSEWKRNSKSLTLDIHLPPNTTATVYVPTSRPGAVSEGNVPAQHVPNLRFLRADPDAALFEIPSGSYQFSVPYP